ncbi:MAG: Rieske 2Fe-2S domain-containing protein [Proteobacteria bacterium]|nr:Rieske 2Fe-2S domain-containing protein [Pseudomonadota bacterium]
MENVPATGLARAETLPAGRYHEPAAFDLERQRIFGREWILIAHEAELERPGDAVAERLAGWPVFVRRGRDGELQGFHDVCRHRAGPIAGAGDGGEARRCTLPVLRCRYHGWVYDESGRLERTPDFGEALDFEPSALGLVPVRVTSWRGFVFVCLDPEAAPLETALGRLPALAQDVPLERYRIHGRANHRLRCNWKAYVENYLEGYHIPYVHPRLHREIDVKGYRIEAAERVVTHHAPPRPRVEEPVYDGVHFFQQRIREATALP